MLYRKSWLFAAISHSRRLFEMTVYQFLPRSIPSICQSVSPKCRAFLRVRRKKIIGTIRRLFCRNDAHSDLSAEPSAAAVGAGDDAKRVVGCVWLRVLAMMGNGAVRCARTLRIVRFQNFRTKPKLSVYHYTAKSKDAVLNLSTSSIERTPSGFKPRSCRPESRRANCLCQPSRNLFFQIKRVCPRRSRHLKPAFDQFYARFSRGDHYGIRWIQARIRAGVNIIVVVAVR